jgi:hypothetical protein
LIISGTAFAQETPTPKELIVGKWKNANNMIYEFTADKKVQVNDKEYATFRFLEGTLVMTYLDSGSETEAGLEFESQDLMTLTEYKGLGEQEKIMLFKRQE